MTRSFPDPEGVLECTREDLLAAVALFWPLLFAATRPDDFSPIVDGHWRVGFSLKLFGPGSLIPGTYEPDPTFEARLRAARRAVELLQRALEDLGFETTREGNAWQDGRLVLGWVVASDGTRLADLPEDHPARIERRERLTRDRAERDVARSVLPPQT